MNGRHRIGEDPSMPDKDSSPLGGGRPYRALGQTPRWGGGKAQGGGPRESDTLRKTVERACSHLPLAVDFAAGLDGGTKCARSPDSCQWRDDVGTSAASWVAWPF